MQFNQVIREEPTEMDGGRIFSIDCRVSPGLLGRCLGRSTRLETRSFYHDGKSWRTWPDQRPCRMSVRRQLDHLREDAKLDHRIEWLDMESRLQRTHTAGLPALTIEAPPTTPSR